MVIAMWCAKNRKCFAAIRRLVETFSAGIDDISIRRISTERHIIKRTLDHPRSDLRRLRMQGCPCCSGVVRNVEPTTRLRFDERIDSIGLGGCDGEICFADQFSWQPICDLREVLAAVSALIKAAVARTADDRPWLALQPRHPGVNDIGIAWLQLEIHCAKLIRDEQNFSPGLPAVHCLEHASL